MSGVFEKLRQSVPCSSRCPVSELEATGSKRLEILDELSALVGAQVGAVLVALMAGIGVAGNRIVTCHGKGHKPAAWRNLLDKPAVVRANSLSSIPSR